MTFWLEVGEPGISRVFSILDHSATTNIDSFDYTPLFLLTLSLLLNLILFGCHGNLNKADLASFIFFSLILYFKFQFHNYFSFDVSF